MTYSAEISRAQPTCVLFLIDQSGSMDDEFEAGTSKAAFLTDAINKSLMELVVRCKRPEGINDYFDVGVLSYGDNAVQAAFGGALAGSHIVPISHVAKSPVRIETRKKRIPDGAGGVLETETKFPIWFDARASGGTPMCEALRTAGDLLAEWCAARSRSFPPIVINISDGEATDGSDRELAAAARHLTNQGTQDGKALLLNLHVSGSGGEPLRFPSSAGGLPQAAKSLFEISSLLPPSIQARASNARRTLTDSSRGFVYRGRMDDVVEFFEIGTRAKLAGGDR